MFALPAGACGLAEAARVTRWLANQNAGQCGPCVYGLDEMARAMDELVEGRHAHAAWEEVGRLMGLVAGRGACKHPDGVVRFVHSSLRTFRDHAALHAERGPCPRATPLLPDTREGWVAMSLEVAVDPIRCDAHGLCAELFPERIKLDRWGFPIIDPKPIPRDLEVYARRAAAACPTLALLLRERAGAAKPR